MGIRFTRDKEAGETGKRQIVMTASPAAYSGLAIVSLLCIIWVFVFGLIVGRGYQPEEIVPELKQFMPVAKNASDFSNQTSAQTSDLAEATPRNIIKAEELNFYEQLKKAPLPHTPNKPKATPVAIKPAPIIAPPASPPVKKAAPAETPKGNVQAYDYVYQVASSQDPKSAELLKIKIEAKGLRTRIERATSGGATWYRVMVLFKGTPEDTRQFKDSLLELGIAKPLLKEKVPQ